VANSARLYFVIVDLADDDGVLPLNRMKTDFLRGGGNALQPAPTLIAACDFFKLSRSKRTMLKLTRFRPARATRAGLLRKQKAIRCHRRSSSPGILARRATSS